MTILGPKVTALVLVHSAMLSFVACVTGSHVCVWVVSVTCIAFLSVQKLKFFMVNNLIYWIFVIFTWIMFSLIDIFLAHDGFKYSVSDFKCLGF